MYSNRVTLIGFLSRDAEVRYSKNQTPFTVLSVATKRSWKDRESGGYKSETTWHRCIAFGHTGEYAAKLTKGAHVQIDGETYPRIHAWLKQERRHQEIDYRDPHPGRGQARPRPQRRSGRGAGGSRLSAALSPEEVGNEYRSSQNAQR